MLGLLGVDLSELVESGLQGILALLAIVVGLLLVLLSLFLDGLFWPGIAFLGVGIVVAALAVTGAFEAIFG
jgi:hypothetical protein